MFRVCPHDRRSAEGLAARRFGVPFSIVGRHSAVPSRCPSPAPHSAPAGRGATRGKARWPRNYRRSATGLAAGAVPLHPGLPAVAGRAYVENVSGLPTWPPLGNRPRVRGSAPAPHSAPTGRGATRGQARWPRDYRRSATGLAARRSGGFFSIVGRHSAVPHSARPPAQRPIGTGRQIRHAIQANPTKKPA